MESSRRAVEAYWRSRLIDHATADDDKITPIYRLDEICDTLRSGTIGVVKEMSEYILKRLDHKSPRVKQKALRLIKYSVVKGGVEFKREMQRHSTEMRQLFHYRGEPDALRGDALNKAVRDMAREAVAAIFSSEDKQTASEDINKRIQGFGNSNFEMALDDRKSFLSEVVEFGTASIRQGLSRISGQSSSNYLDEKNNSAGSYRGPSLRKSLTMERETIEKHQRYEPSTEAPFSLDDSEHRNLPSNHDHVVPSLYASNGKFVSSQERGSSREEKLLDSITAAGGVRLQPSREMIQTFLSEVPKLDSVVLSKALELKLQSHLWQVRLKAMCVLESILRQREQKCFETVATFFEENKDVVVSCTESPQTSLKEKANRVLDLLGGRNKDEVKTTTTEMPKNPMPPVSIEMPDLIDTGKIDLLADGCSPQAKHCEGTKAITSSVMMVDLLGDNILSAADDSKIANAEENPFAGLAIHTDENGGTDLTSDLFSGMVVGNSTSLENKANEISDKNGSSLLSGLANNGEQDYSKSFANAESLEDLMGSLSVNQPLSDRLHQNVNVGSTVAVTPGSGPQFLQQNYPAMYPAFGNLSSSQMMGLNSSHLPTVGSMDNFPIQNLTSNMMMHQAIPLQAMSFGPIGNSFAQQQLLAAMANLQQFRIGADSEGAGFLRTNSGTGRGTVSSFTDGFDFSSDPMASRVSTTESTRKEETRAFDFISVIFCGQERRMKARSIWSFSLNVDKATVSGGIMVSRWAR